MPELEVIDLCSSDEEERGSSPKRAKKEPSLAEEDISDDSCMVVDAPTPAEVPTTGAATSQDEDGDECMVVGGTAAVSLPHLRCHCTEYPFDKPEERTKACDCCYCYLCDKPTKECSDWKEHSAATDSGPLAGFWKRQRRLVQSGKPMEKIATPTTFRFQGRSAPININNQSDFNQWHRKTFGCYAKSFSLFHDFLVAKQNAIRNGTASSSSSSNSYSSSSNNYSGPVGRANSPYAAPPPRPPRPVPPPAPAHRCDLCDDVVELLGSRPGAMSLALPVMIFNNLTGKQKKHIIKESIPQAKKTAKNNNTMRYGGYHAAKTSYELLQLVRCIQEGKEAEKEKEKDDENSGDSSGSEKKWLILLAKPRINGLAVTIPPWTKPAPQPCNTPLALRRITLGTMKGMKFRMKMNNTPNCPISRDSRCIRLYERYVGTEPLAVNMQHLVMGPRVNGDTYTFDSRRGLVFANQSDAAFLKAALKDADSKQSLLLAEMSARYDEATNSGELDCTLILKPNAIKHTDGLPGMKQKGTTSTPDFTKILERLYYGDQVKEEATRFNGHNVTKRFEGKNKMSGGYASLDTSLKGLLVSLRVEQSSLIGAAHLSNITDTLQELESKGHESLLQQPEELTVQLYEHQKQAVQWMLQQEKLPHGSMEHVWAQVPLLGQPSVDAEGAQVVTAPPAIYFSPIVNQFTSVSPYKGVKGGILADEMGLGKTAATLSLILKNRPRTDKDEAEWGEVIKPVEPATSKFKPSKMAVHYCKGTLVVCHVSLVGQWIEEAKRLCGDTLKIYPYHGGSRCRDASKLAGYDLVVTTYGILSAEERHKAHMPTLMSLNFWRIVLDESHSIRNRQAKVSAAAIKRLFANRKWCMTGSTPMNTRLTDIEMQLNFIGVTGSADKIWKWVNGWGQVSPSSIYHYENMALMRRVMMRHSHKQTLEGKHILGLPTLATEEVVVKLTPEERVAYDKLEKQLQERYIGVRHLLRYAKGSHSMKVLTILNSFRQACSGGQVIHAELDDVQVESPCGICNEVMESPTKTPCGHAFCNPCITALITRHDSEKGSCPKCKKTVTLESVALLSDLAKQKASEEAAAGAAALAEAAQAAAQAAAAAAVPADPPASAPAVPAPVVKYTPHPSMFKLHRPDGTPLAMPAPTSAVPAVPIVPAVPTAAGALTPAVVATTTAPAPTPTGGAVSIVGVTANSSPIATAATTGATTVPAVPAAATASGGAGGADNQAAPAAPGAAAAAGGGGAVLMESKLNKLVERLTEIRHTHPESKSLVFSQFNSTINWLTTVLPKKGLKFRTLTGSMSRSKRTEALKAFQSDPPTTVFLLSVRAGAVGINLTQANHCFMLEPCLNLALERQAIGRVHRLGQERPVTVHKLYMENSVESRILKIQKKTEASGQSSNMAGSITKVKKGQPLSSFDEHKVSSAMPIAPYIASLLWNEKHAKTNPLLFSPPFLSFFILFYPFLFVTGCGQRASHPRLQ
ncbi:unnamed protein product [Chrysoparadoxa australica]